MDMINSLCLYLESWNEDDNLFLKRIAKWNYPIFIPAGFLQKCKDIELFLSLFNEGQVRLLSEDVDLNVSSLSLAIRACEQVKATHLIQLNHLSEDLLNSVEDISSIIEKNKEVSLFCFINKDDKLSKQNHFLSKILNLESVDYRTFQSKNNIYNISHIQELRSDVKLCETQVLIYLLKNKKTIMPLFLNQEQRGKQIERKRKRKKIKDYYYSILLSFYSILYGNINPIRAGFSFAMGIFVACTPFYGLHTLLILAFSYIFRLNFPIACLASQISLPPIYAVIVFVQLYVGQYVLNRPFLLSGNYLQIAQENFYTWYIGSLVVGFALSIISGYLWYRLQIYFNRRNVVLIKV